MNTKGEAIFEKRPHYEVLDGLRGIAALSILVFHYIEIIHRFDYENIAIAHTYLAVDFFFLLSGFVIAYAYDKRMLKIGVGNFFINRLIRLHPLVVFGSIIGVAGYLLSIDATKIPEIGFTKFFLSFTGSITLIPTPLLPFRGGCIFPYNPSAWSLFSEYFISLVYAFFLFRLRNKQLLWVGIACAIWLIAQGAYDGWINTGWGAKSFWGGFPRVSFSFVAGMLINRYALVIKNRFSMWLPTILLLAVFIIPHYENDWILETFLVIVIFPIILSLGAGASVGIKGGVFCKFIGDLSYPLYMTHASTTFIFAKYVWGSDIPIHQQYIWSFALMGFNIIMAQAILEWFDKPIRAWLKKRRKEYLFKKSQKI